jgi:hypothetical protein
MEISDESELNEGALQGRRPKLGSNGPPLQGLPW